MKKTFALPIDQLTISEYIGRNILSPILVDCLENLGLDQEKFLDTFAPFFKELPYDPYDVRRLKIEFLKNIFAEDKENIHAKFKDFYLGKTTIIAFEEWTNQLTNAQKQIFEAIVPWRRRSVAQFLIDLTGSEVTIEREPVSEFSQEVDEADIRSMPRSFKESPSHHVDIPIFTDFAIAIGKKVQEFTPKKIKKLRFTAHFMSVQATPKTPGDNSPEGAHEDGADFIISALVVNRINVKGGESQIIEQLEGNAKDIIFRRELAPGEFILQADTGEEEVYGNDLWHHVTPFYLDDASKSEGWRDIIGFDILIVD